MSDHTAALVPLGSGYHQSTDVFARGRPVDTGLLAEALVYYDRVLMNVDSPVQFSQLISWLIQQGLSAADITALFRAGVFEFYYFAFTTNPYVEFESPERIRIKGLWNIQDRTMQEPKSFFKRFVPPVREYFENTAQFERFVSALEGRVIEIKADDIGATAIENAYRDFLNPQRSALMAQELVNEIYRIKSLGKPPEIIVEVVDRGAGEFAISWNVPLHRLPALEGETNIKAAVTLPLSTAAAANKYLWATDRLRCDLYLSRPISALVGDKLFEAADVTFGSMTKAAEIVQELEAKVEFPDLRRLVNLDKIDFPKVLEIREKAGKFRRWLQSEADRDRDALIAYHQEVAQSSGFSGVAVRTLKMFGVIGGAAVGAAMPAHPIVGAAAGAAAADLIAEGTQAAIEYLFDLGSNLGRDWKPIVFGNWYKQRIAKLLTEEANA